MSVFEEIDQLLVGVPNVLTATVKPDEEMVREAEQRLGVAKLPDSFRTYLLRYGHLSFGTIEYLGLTGSPGFEESMPNFVWYTLRRRELLPSGWVLFRNENGEVYFCVDTSQTLPSGENPVAVFDVIDQTPCVMAMGFGEFLKADILDYIEERSL